MQIKKFPMNYLIANFVRNLKERDVKGFALNTHEGLRPSTMQAFEKAWAKLLSVLGQFIS